MQIQSRPFTFDAPSAKSCVCHGKCKRCKPASLHVGAPLQLTQSGIKNPTVLPSPCAFADIPNDAATPPGFPHQGGGLFNPDLLKVAVQNSFEALSHAHNGPGLLALSTALQTLGYHDSAACLSVWAAYYGATLPTLPVGGVPVSTNGPTGPIAPPAPTDSGSAPAEKSNTGGIIVGIGVVGAIATVIALFK